MAELRQRSLFENSDAHGDCAEYVGVAPPTAARCFHQFHGAAFECSMCGWNLCQICKGQARDVCVQCGLADCEKCKTCDPRKKDPCCLLCHTLSYPAFIGWSGVCGTCRKDGKGLAPKRARLSSDVPVPQQQSPGFMCVPSLMPTPVHGVGHTEVVEPERSALIRAYEQRRLEGVMIGSQLAGYHGSAPPVNVTVVEVRRISNPFVERRFKAHTELVQAINGARPKNKQFKGTGVETVYHGTSSMFVSSIVEKGFETRYNRNTVYGNHAIYVSKYPYVPEMHAPANPAGFMHVFECEAIIGNNVNSKELGAAPLASNADSGGDGSGHIFALFNNACLWPKFLYRLKVCQ